MKTCVVCYHELSEEYLHDLKPGAVCKCCWVSLTPKEKGDLIKPGGSLKERYRAGGSLRRTLR